MTPLQVEAARTELNAVIRESWAIHARTGDPKDAEQAREMEAQARALLAFLPARRGKLKKSNKALKRKASKRLVRLDAGAPILAQLHFRR